MQPTTASLHTPAGRGGIAVIVLDGHRAGGILGEIFRPSTAGPRESGRLRLGEIHRDGQVLDQAIVRASDTVAEISIHGGPQVARAVLDLLRRQGAEILPASACPPGGLPEAHPEMRNPAVGRELLEALPAARSSFATALLTHQWSSGVSRLAREILQGLAEKHMKAADADACRAAAERLPQVRRLLHPAEVVLAGPPNAGKSTLMNRLVGRHVSLVHDRPGTTRDWVREPAILDGVPVWLTDTAGLWASAEGIDAEAVRRAHTRAAQADVVVLIGAGSPPKLPPWWNAGRVIRAAGQCDIHPADPSDADVTLSGVTGYGMAELKDRIRCLLGLADLDAAATAAFTERQAELLTSTADAILSDNGPGAAAALEKFLSGPAEG